jgi:pimeloyl-ACP methyl ester carboxylesterase
MTESSFLFGDAGSLVGTLSRATQGVPAGTVGILLLNAGVIARTGPHRMNVKLARAFAALGYPSLRFDLAGLGDSPRSSGSLPYEQQSVADICSAMDRLSALTGLEQFVLVGFCSGADNGLNAALTDPRLQGLVMFDAYTYPNIRTHLTRMLERLRQQGLLATAKNWLRHRLKKSKAPTQKPLGEPEPSAPQSATSSRIVPPKAVFAEQMVKLVERGCRFLFIYSGSFLYTYNHAGQFASTFKAWPALRGIRSDFMPEVDHVVGECRAQLLLQTRLTEWVTQQFPPQASRTS